MLVKIAVLVSGGGTNLQAVIDAEKDGRLPHGSIVSVISDKADAYALKRAEDAGIRAVALPKKSFPDKSAFEVALIKEIEKSGAELIVLAGFLTILSPGFIRTYPRRILNIHPALLPEFGGDGFYGLRVHRAVLAAGRKVSGATVHYVTEVVDGGEIIAQKQVKVLETDDEESLQLRIMQEAEWVIYPEAIEKVCKNMSVRKGEAMQRLKENSYPGRGIVIGKSEDGNSAVISYFIMGRSVNSRNRIFVEDGEGLRTVARDPALLTDPSLIIYHPVRVLNDVTVVTNGDQTDTVYEFLKKGKSFKDALDTREFEPDRPNYTPRISGLVNVDNGDFTFKLSILKGNGEEEPWCNRFYFDYNHIAAGKGKIIHTYDGDGNPVPSFTGEPRDFEIKGGIEDFAADLWNSLNVDNKVALFVRYINLNTREVSTKLINR